MVQPAVRTSVLLALILICTAVLGIVAWREYTIHKSTPTAVPPSVYIALNKNNQFYTQGLASVNKGDYESAITQFQSAASTTTDVQELFVVQLYLANTYIDAGQYENAVATLQDIVKDTKYSPQIRAYVVYRMGSLYAGDTGGRITKAIFAVPPYQYLVVPNHVPLTYRHLFEYSTQISPNAYADVQIAYWYADKAMHAHQNPTAIASSTASFIQGAHKWLAATTKDPNFNSSTFIGRQDPLFFSFRYALVLEDLARAGDTTAGDPESVFRQLLVQTKDEPEYSLDAYVRLQYAYYLELQYGAKRKSDIVTILAPLSAPERNINDDHSARIFLTDSAKNKTLGNRSTIIAVANLDPDFKQFLISLGWTAQDFVSK